MNPLAWLFGNREWALAVVVNDVAFAAEIAVPFPEIGGGSWLGFASGKGDNWFLAVVLRLDVPGPWVFKALVTQVAEVDGRREVVCTAQRLDDYAEERVVAWLRRHGFTRVAKYDELTGHFETASAN
jgi:hypothetical protein